MTVLPTATVPLADERILANSTGLERWDTYNKHIFSVLFLSTKGAAKSFSRPFFREARLETATRRAGGVEGIGREVPQLLDAATTTSDVQAERDGHDAKSRP